MSWWDRIFPTRKILTEVQATAWGNARLLAELQHMIETMGDDMADVSNVLNDVAGALRDNLGPRITDLLAENAELRNRNAELEGEDVAESDAAANVKTAFDGVAGLFDQTDEAPTPEPLPDEGTPGSPGAGGPQPV